MAGAHPGVRADPVDTAMNLEPIKALIKQRLGLQFAGHTEVALRHALEKRKVALDVASIAAYLDRLRVDEAEWHELTSSLTINETYFYREPQHLRLLTEVLAADLLARRNAANKVRILSVGCSTGEEPYSIAIALQERYGLNAARLFQITAGDVDQRALKKARSGLYGAYSFRALPDQLAKRYFTMMSHQHRRINEAIRQQVSLHHVNALVGAYPQDWLGQDVVFFRNVSIYFDAATRKAIQRRLQTLLNPGGYLIVGATETLANDFGCMVLQERDGVFFFANHRVDSSAVDLDQSLLTPLCQNGKPEIYPNGKPEIEDSGASVTSFLIQEPVETRYQHALALAQGHQFDEALRVLAPLCDEDAPLVCCLTLQAHLLFERRDAIGATAVLERALALDAWSVDALLLRGRIARLQGELEDAICYFRQAIYHNPDCWSAHYHLA
ncbi:MAG: hypothetical protein KDI50_11850, partial [Candidatus Competibacteraceae bacterium]|nr:hypothetical protein [Candidatus Competibacteraceae bacterium]